MSQEILSIRVVMCHIASPNQISLFFVFCSIRFVASVLALYGFIGSRCMQCLTCVYQLVSSPFIISHPFLLVWSILTCTQHMSPV